ncbi:MAG TPA: signal peptidase I [bacterium]|jgi:signal peptidase I
MSQKEKKIAIAKVKWLRLCREWGKAALLAVVIVLPLRSSIADWYEVPTGSMKPTIMEGDRVFVNKLAYDLKVPFTTWHIATWGAPSRGDVVVLKSPTDGIRLVKRVIGIPGDVIAMQNDRLTVNGQPVDYAPIDESAFHKVMVNDADHYKFFAEALPGKDHTVMITPGTPAMRSFGAVQVPAGSYFVMGDNRDNSADSRYIGFISRDRIMGHALAVVMSFNYDNYHLPRLNRFLLPL